MFCFDFFVREIDADIEQFLNETGGNKKPERVSDYVKVFYIIQIYKKNISYGFLFVSLFSLLLRYTSGKQ